MVGALEEKRRAAMDEMEQAEGLLEEVWSMRARRIERERPTDQQRVK